MTDMNQIYDRIQKLLAMAKDASSPNEAMIAMERARRLMNKHQIEESDLWNQDNYQMAMDCSFLLKKKYKFMPQWLNMLAVAVSKLNGVRVGLAYQNIAIAGLEDDVRLAKMMYDRLVEECNRLCKIDQIARGFGGKYNAKIGDAFKKGFAMAIQEKVNEIITHQAQEVDSTALIVRKNDIVTEKFGETQTITAKFTTKDKATDAYYEGKRHGNNAKIQTEI